LPDLTYHIDVIYLLSKLDLHVTALTHKKVSQKKEYDFSSMEKITALMSLPQYVGHPLIILYRSIIALIETQDDETYFRALSSLEQYSETTPAEILKTFYAVAINYCVSKMWTDRLGYARKMFDLFDVMHGKNLLLDDDFIAVNWLKNMIAIGCFVEEFDWAEKMIEYYRLYIRGDVRESVCHFNYGALAFHQKDYETAHDRFSQVEKVNNVYDINTRVLILKCLYGKEKEYNEYTMTAFRSAESFFKLNKQLPQRNKKGYINFIKILMALYRIRHREGTRTVEWAEEQLEQQEVNSDKRWLLEKIEELKGRKQRSW